MFSARRPTSSVKLFTPGRLASTLGLATLATLMGTSSAIAQTRLPTVPDLDFQTSAPLRGLNIGDWYTNSTSASTDPVHRFFIDITQADIDAAGGSVAITIEDGESNGVPDETNDALAPTRFRLLDPAGKIIHTADFPTGSPNGSNFTFAGITQPGTYTVTSETGGIPILGDNTLGLNNDDNSFDIVIPIDNLLIGQLQGSFQFNGAGETDLELFFLVGPGTDELQLRNFDLDDGFDTNVAVSYTNPAGGVTAGTTSDNAVWNGGTNDPNVGADVINTGAAPIANAGRWSINLINYNENNQTILEVNSNLRRLPVLDVPPIRAGNFTITQDTTLTTTICTEVCHPFTETNNFFTNDIVNLAATGTDPNVIAQLRDVNGNPLTDSDGDGAVDTGILTPGQSATFFLCVTPQPGAPSVDVTTITGTSFMDTTIRQQAVADGVPGATLTPTTQSVVKRTLIPAPSIGLAKTNSALRPVAGSPGLFDVDLTFVVTNTGTTPLANVQIAEDLQEVFVDNPTVNGAPSDGADSIVSVTLTNPITFTGSGTAPTFNGAYNGNADIGLFSTGSNFNPGDTATITITTRLDLSSDNSVDIDNSATATGSPPGGGTVTDVSQAGGDVAPDGDGDPTNNNVPNRIRIPSIGVSKSVSPATLIGGTTYEFAYTITVVNTGTITLDNVQLTEDLQAALITNAFNRADSFTVQNVAVSFPAGAPVIPPVANPVYNGVSVTTLFDATSANQFAPGESATVVVTVQADLGATAAGPSVNGLNDGILEAQNVAEASGTPLGGGDPVTDVSQDGNNVDPDNDGNPNNNNTPTTLFVNTGPNLVVVKRISNVFRQGVPVAVTGLTQFNDQAGFIDDNALNSALGGGNALPGVFVLPAGFALQPDDEVEYTIYFWNNGGSAVSQVRLCDELQPPSVLNTA
ncbi:MAG: hypothetical protein ACFB0G_13860, partial [Leptolyngbyaceae cyanobacterium]